MPCEGVHDGESFVALAEALQNAPQGCGGVPAEHRSDSLSTCFRNRSGSYAAEYTTHVAAVDRLLDHSSIIQIDGESYRRKWVHACGDAAMG